LSKNIKNKQPRYNDESKETERTVLLKGLKF